MASTTQGGRQDSRLGNPASGARQGSVNRGFVSIDPERQPEVPADDDQRKGSGRTGQAGTSRAGKAGSKSTPHSN